MTKRYILKKGRFGCYFYDLYINVDFSLEMILNRLNGMDNTIDKLRVKNAKLKDTIYELNSKELGKILDGVKKS